MKRRNLVILDIVQAVVIAVLAWSVKWNMNSLCAAVVGGGLVTFIVAMFRDFGNGGE